ncbi:hypothetical protein OG562_37745 [Streptomyces sp. NBC_01275]|uniref:hypothetical protein n=1 Tax=Streptomyces sp. NBC_01275 TaxID=2903807 RepID=UPI002257607F|nr:hypothetical protein [Streptomyces sp. NBC_01275]MCX4766622.1 hypothetical protein [Streptomyces sp. NBC_01275]
MASPAPTPRPGDQLAAVGGGTRVIVIRAPEGAAAPIECGGAPMVPARQAPAVPPAAPPSASSAAETPATLVGKRYVDADDTLELLCTASGAGRLTYGGQPLTVKAPKALPASD